MALIRTNKAGSTGLDIVSSTWVNISAASTSETVTLTSGKKYIVTCWIGTQDYSSMTYSFTGANVLDHANDSMTHTYLIEATSNSVTITESVTTSRVISIVIAEVEY